MSSKSNIIVGLDIGTSSTTVVVAEVLEDSVKILGVGKTPSSGLRKGVVINIEGTVEAISKAVGQAERSANVEISTVYASIGGAHVKGFNSNGVVPIKNKEVSKHDIERVIEAAKAVAIPSDREVLHVLPQEFVIDSQDGIRQPLGISGVRLEAKVHIVTGSITSAQNVVKCANRCSLTVRDIVVSSLASGEAVLSPEEKELGVCLVDVGGGTTDIVVYHSGSVRHVAVLPVGGNHLTNDIAAGLRTPIAAAEDIKQRHATASLRKAHDDEIIEVPSTGGRPPRVLSKQVLTEIIQPRVEEIFHLVHRELLRTGADEYLTSGIVLTGGSANLEGIESIAQDVFHLPIRVGLPRNFKGLSDTDNLPDLSTALGLVRIASKENPITKYSGNSGSFFKNFLRRVNEWFSDGM
ncbi:MAG: cell division protein FtsA [Deltaproteobacteria bacterium]|nr:cell division protein FtsA [Deltaproteobacteria bacterium]